MTSLLCKMRRMLDALYTFAGGLAAVCLFALLLVIVAQMVARAASINFPGSTDYAGYLMAASSFLAFAYTLNRGGHVRVSLLIGRLTGSARYAAEVLCHVLALIMTTILAWYAVAMVYWSYELNDVSQGQDASPLWIVQSPLAIGAVILAICFLDNLVSLLVRKQDNIAADIVG